MAISKALARAAPKRLDDAVAAAVVLGQPPADEIGVRGDLVAVPGQQPGEWHGGGLPQALEVLDPRPRPRPVGLQGRVDLRVGRDPAEQVVADEGKALALVDEQRVGGAVPGPRDDAQVAAAGADDRAVGQLDVGVVGVRRALDEVPESLVVGDDCLGHAVVAHEREREAAVRGGPLGVAAAVGGRAVERGDPGAGAAGDRGGQAGVVEMVVRDEDQLDVLDADAVAREARLER